MTEAEREEIRSEPAPKYHFPPTYVLNDNKGATQTVNNPMTNWATRFLANKYFKTRDYIKDGLLRVAHIPTDKNVSDFFTKDLHFAAFVKFRTYLGFGL